ncbi:MAG TPA: holo-ACP synthase [Marmoricola sp.]|nr:holo-ACP synthase [Marmoricola sp.]
MIIGIGIDVVDIGRFEDSLARTPALRDKLFTTEEATLPVPSLAARFAAKEAIAKALGAPGGLGWHDCVVLREQGGRPRFELRGTVLARANDLGVLQTHLSLSHDAGIASAMVVLEGEPPA